MKKKIIKISAIVICIILGGTLAVYGIKTAVSAFNTSASSSQKSIFPTSDGIVCQGTAEGDDVNINSKLPGKLSNLFVKEGQQIKVGDIISTIENGELNAKKQQLLSQIEAAKAMYTASMSDVIKARNGVAVSEADVEKAKAGVAVAEAKVREAQAGVDASDSQVSAAQSVDAKAENGARLQELAQAQAQYDLWKKTYERVKNLNEKGAVPSQKVDEVEAQLKVAEQTLSMAKEGARLEDRAGAKANVAMAIAGRSVRDNQVQQAVAGLDAANLTLRQATLGLNVANATLQQAQAGEQGRKAQYEQAQAGLQEVESYLKDTTIVAPIDGIITTVNANAGELISTGMPIAVIANLNNVTINFKVKETDITAIKEGQAASVKLPSIDDVVYTGKVVSINRMPDYATKRSTGENGNIDIVSYSVKVSIDNINGKIRAGMTAYAQFKK